MYLPQISDARHERSYRLGPFLVTLLTDCVSAGKIEYAHIMVVYAFNPQDAENSLSAVMAVASEVNKMPQGGSHFLGVFTGDHLNMGASNEWADLEQFSQKALDIISKRFKINEPPQLLMDEDRKE